ncbi:MAG TPA: AAA family ATPase, partial [Stackebrandtia sp.]|uniref:ATP-binding protein n=1 Tax=Stackebrandtia sp. TaxID=2023065 RepID=UPI002D410C24
MIADVPRLGAGVPLIARRAELHTLTQAWRSARSGRPSVVLVSGDAGVGKSRLLAELSTLVTDDAGIVLTGRCLDTTDAALPYLPFAEIVGEVADRDPAVIDAHPALSRMLPGRGERDGHPADERDLGRLQLFDAVHAALSRFSAEHPVVIAIEDLHWADRSSRDLLAFLASRLSGQRLLVVGTYRADDLHRRHPLRPLLAELVRLPVTERLHLDPFSTSDARDFVRALADEDLSEDTIARIAERCEGNAFVAEELVSASGDDAVPRELAEVLLARAERLSPNAQQAVRLASVIGKSFGHDRISGASSLSAAELDDALREAVQHNILVMDASDDYAFRHALLREAVYTDLLPGERSRLHHDIAAALARTDGCVAAELAHHAMASHDSPGALAASVRAAKEADEVSAPAETLSHVERALQLWHSVNDPEHLAGTDELELTVWAAAAAAASGEPDRAIAHSRSAIRMIDSHGDTRRAVEVRRAYARYLLTLENTEQRAYDTALEAWELVAEAEPSTEKAWVQAILARAATAAGKR